MTRPTTAEAAAAGKSIRRLRDLAGLTLDQVAADASVSVSYLSKVERGIEVASPEWIAEPAPPAPAPPRLHPRVTR